ncbi:TPA: prophage tail fiber N-terminal domain-containing protein, partial [Shigella boydii]
MSVVISGALTDGAGIPMSGCQIILKSRVNTSEVVMRTRADVVTGNNGEYSFEAQVGKYCVYLKRDWRDEYCVGDIAVYDDSKPGTLKTANHLSEIAAAGEKAQQKSRDNLGLKSAATMEAQSDIYDRTKGRLAIPGAFGFGCAFLPEDVIRFDTKSDFQAWVRNALPGEYSVAGPYDIIIPDTRFEGVLSIRWTDARPETTEPRYRAKSLTFYGINGPIYHTRYCYWPISRL